MVAATIVFHFLITALAAGVIVAGTIDSTDSPTPTLQASISPPPEYLTITIINSRPVPISTAHASNAGAPSPISGDNGPGTIAVGGTASFAVPTGWGGNVAIIDAFAEDGVTPLSETGDNSLIEASFIIPKGYNIAVADVVRSKGSASN